MGLLRYLNVDLSRQDAPDFCSAAMHLLGCLATSAYLAKLADVGENLIERGATNIIWVVSSWRLRPSSEVAIGLAMLYPRSWIIQKIRRAFDCGRLLRFSDAWASCSVSLYLINGVQAAHVHCC